MFQLSELLKHQASAHWLVLSWEFLLNTGSILTNKLIYPILVLFNWFFGVFGLGFLFVWGVSVCLGVWLVDWLGLSCGVLLLFGWFGGGSSKHL